MFVGAWEFVKHAVDICQLTGHKLCFGWVPYGDSRQSGPAQPVVIWRLLGIIIDDNLSFNEHISVCCTKAARQLNALARIAINILFH